MKAFCLLFITGLVLLNADASERRRFKIVDGVYTKGEFIDTDPKKKQRLYIRYNPIVGTGVALELTVGDKLLWRAHVEPIAPDHSAYGHSVWVRVEKGTIFVTSHLPTWSINERRELKTGKLIDRITYDSDSE